MTRISKTNYILWRACHKNAWLNMHRPEIYSASEITEFEQSILETGVEVEEVARRLFPGGLLVEGPTGEARQTTQRHITARASTLFQPAFDGKDLFAVVDVLTFNQERNAYAIYEIKSSTSVKEEHLYDVAFQSLVLQQHGLKIEGVFVVHLNPDYVRKGDLDLPTLFVSADVTQKVEAVVVTVGPEIEEARPYLLNNAEPPGACSCIYKGRSRHCTTFRYSNPQVPEYSVHDLARIGNSPKKLKQMVDAAVFALDEIPAHVELSEIQQAQVRAYTSGETVIRKREIAAELKKLQYPLHFIDYETAFPAIPRFDNYAPYDHIPFQYSLHIVRAPDEKPIHKEFLHSTAGDPSESFIASLQENIDRVGSVVVWNKTFESDINKALARRIPAVQEFIADVNGRIYDLKLIFDEQFYVHRDFRGKTSIKSVLPVLAPKLSYATLEIQDGGSASVSWSKLISGSLEEEKRIHLYESLKQYCGMDSYAMYAIWRALQGLVSA